MSLAPPMTFLLLKLCQKVVTTDFVLDQSRDVNHKIYDDHRNGLVGDFTAPKRFDLELFITLLMRFYLILP